MGQKVHPYGFRIGCNKTSRSRWYAEKKYAELGYIGCTNCLYCQPCPQGVLIPQVIGVLNENYTKSREETKEAYLEGIPEEGRAGRCAQCGTCEEHCPQGLPIMNLMRSTARFYEGH